VPISSVDLYPTLLELSGAKPPAGQPLDGVSYASLLIGGGKQELAREAIYWHFPGYLGAGGGTWRTTPVGVIRGGDWKLMEFFEDGRLELDNLREDVGDRKDLSASMPDKVHDLHAQLASWRQTIAAPMPAPHDPAPRRTRNRAGPNVRQRSPGPRPLSRDPRTGIRRRVHVRESGVRIREAVAQFGLA
jgi:arylsulfatase A-like enzyme